MELLFCQVKVPTQPIFTSCFPSCLLPWVCLYFYLPTSFSATKPRGQKMQYEFTFSLSQPFYSPWSGYNGNPLWLSGCGAEQRKKEVTVSCPIECAGGRLGTAAGGLHSWEWVKCAYVPCGVWALVKVGTQEQDAQPLRNASGLVARLWNPFLPPRHHFLFILLSFPQSPLCFPLPSWDSRHSKNKISKCR